MRPYGQVDQRLADQELDFGAEKLKFDRYTNRFRKCQQQGAVSAETHHPTAVHQVVLSPSCRSLHIKTAR